MKIGDILKRARVDKGLTLSQIAKDILVQEKYLRALEEGDYNVIPGEAYQRAYFRTYAEFLGLGNYIENLAKPHQFSSEMEEKSVDGIFDGPWTTARVARVALKIVVVPLVVVFLIIVVARAIQSPKIERPGPNRVTSTQPGVTVVPADPEPVWNVPPGNDASDSQNQLSSMTHTISLKALGQCWVNLKTRDGSLIRRIMVAGESVTFNDLIGFYLNAGMPEKLQVIFDGQPVEWEQGQTEMILPPGAAVLPEPGDQTTENSH